MLFGDQVRYQVRWWRELNSLKGLSLNRTRNHTHLGLPFSIADADLAGRPSAPDDNPSKGISLAPLIYTIRPKNGHLY